MIWKESGEMGNIWMWKSYKKEYTIVFIKVNVIVHLPLFMYDIVMIIVFEEIKKLKTSFLNTIHCKVSQYSV